MQGWCWTRVLWWGVLCLVTPLSAFPQTTGSLRGVVVDGSGDLLAGVLVTVASPSRGVGDRGAVSDRGGAFLVTSLPVATDYSVRASLPGYAGVVVSDVEVSAGRATPLRIILQPEGAVRERVKVQARPPVVDLEDATTATRFGSEFVDALPILGRNYQDVLALAPGVSDVDGDGNPNIHGARDTDVVTLVDGVSTTDPLTGKVGAQLNIESIQEIEVKTAGVTAEFGRAQGGFANIITKSGGNEFQGALKFFWRGSALDGDGAGIDDPGLHAGVGESGLRDLTFNDYLPFLSLGGPIVKDRAWFYMAHEYIQKEKPVNALNLAFVEGVREFREFAKLTWQVSPSHRLALSVNYDPQELLNQGLNSFTRQETGYTTGQGGLVVTLKGTSVLSPVVSLETSLSSFDGRPTLDPNLGRDTNGNGILYFDRNGNGFRDASELDPGDDLDQDGIFDVFEDFATKPPNRILDKKVGEDLDGDGRVTSPFGCEGALREDQDCDGHLDNIEEDRNGDGFISIGEVDIDGDRRLDHGTEDRNGNGRLDDALRPTGLYPYGKLVPESPDREYRIDETLGVVSGPYYLDLSDRRKRVTLRQDLSIFLAGGRGMHDLRLGLAAERERFDRQTESGDVIAVRKDSCFLPASIGEDAELVCTAEDERPTLKALLPVEPVVDNRANALATALYFQDNYKPVPNVTIGLGLRFDREKTDSFGYSFFDPVTERAPFDRLNALMGFEVGKEEQFLGNNDGVQSQGVMSDPIFGGLGDVREATAYIIEPLRKAALGRLTRHHSAVAFISEVLPEVGDGDQLDEQQLAQLGVVAQQRESFSLTNNNLAPRLSFSWDPGADGRTKLFATWGRYYDKLFLSTIVGEEGPDYLDRYYFYDATGMDVRYGTHFFGYSPVLGGTPNHYAGRSISKSPPSTTQIDRALQTPFSDELTVGFQREIAPEVSLSLTYINRRFRDQLQDIDVNHSLRLDPGTGEPIDRLGNALVLAGGSKIKIPDGRPDLYIFNPFFNQVLRIGNFNEARYSAIEVELKRRLSRRWQMQGSYTYSRAVGDAEDFQSRLGNDPSSLESEFGSLDYDQRHVVKLITMVYFPRDVQLGSSLSWASGLPYSVISRFFALDNIDYQQYRTRFGYTVREPGSEPRFRSVQRNSERNDAAYNIDLSLKKSFVVGRSTAAASLEVSNLLNTDDLRIFTYEPNKNSDTARQALTGPLQVDGVRRFGRRLQLGVQFEF
jgi:carboxypeptidase family protein/TonB-dependent receptor-like protein